MHPDCVFSPNSSSPASSLSFHSSDQEKVMQATRPAKEMSAYAAPSPSKMMRFSNPLMFLLVLFCRAEIMIHGFKLQSLSSRSLNTAGGVSIPISPLREVVVVGNGHTHTTTTTVAFAIDGTPGETPSPPSLRQEAESLQAKARQLREEIEKQREESLYPVVVGRATTSSVTTNHDDNKTSSLQKSSDHVKTRAVSSPWTIATTTSDMDKDSADEAGEFYRLYVDVGREDGTWMDPRWGASGKRIPFALDVKLQTELADPTVAALMLNDNKIGTTSKVYTLQTAQFARLNGGFDRMRCYGGAYLIDVANGRYTLRMMIQVEGTKADQNYMYGDVSIPKGGLYFSLPCFGGRISQLSKKEGPVTVRQSGWHTGWRRKESRILGVFNAKPLAEAKQRDPY
jgi:hypothetical protein